MVTIIEYPDPGAPEQEWRDIIVPMRARKLDAFDKQQLEHIENLFFDEFGERF